MSKSSTGTDVHDELHKLRAQLNHILDYMSTYEPPIPKPPILDSSLDDPWDDAGTERLPGLRALKDSVKRDLEVLEKFLADPKCDSLPGLSTNAPYLIAVWKEVLCAPQPVLTIWKTFAEQDEHTQPRRRNRGRSKYQGAKVDVVADGGWRWIRVNTIKNSRLLAEFREADSYLTGSEDEDRLSPTLAQPSFDNSVLRMGRSLISAAAVANKQHMSLGDIGSSDSRAFDSIKVSIRLTRLDPAPEDDSQYDSRIGRTINELKQMGIDVEFGELEVPPAQPRLPSRTLWPTTKVNLDLSILIALISDLTHSSLPKNTEEADFRFVPPVSYLEWKKTRKGGTTQDDISTGKEEHRDVPDSAKHSRALSNQALQEMDRGLLQDIHDRLASSAATPSPRSGSTPSVSPVEFWTTAEARDRCLRIVAKIGGTNEKKRAHALFYPFAADDESERTCGYWHNSRFPNRFISIPPIRIFDPLYEPTDKSSNPPPSSFFSALEKTCVNILSQEVTPHPKALPAHLVVPSPSSSSPFMSASLPMPILSSIGDDGDEDGGEGRVIGTLSGAEGEIQRATVTKANPKLTAHTVQSLLQGARRGWTTLTANKSSVKAVLKEIKILNGSLVGGSVDSAGGAGSGATFEAAAIWIVDPRSLAEGMRSDSIS